LSKNIADLRFALVDPRRAGLFEGPLTASFSVIPAGFAGVLIRSALQQLVSRWGRLVAVQRGVWPRLPSFRTPICGLGRRFPHRRIHATKSSEINFLGRPHAWVSSRFRQKMARPAPIA